MHSDVLMVLDVVTFVGLVVAFALYDWWVTHEPAARAAEYHGGRGRRTNVVALRHEMHDPTPRVGRIHLDSEVRRGSRFTVELPRG